MNLYVLHDRVPGSNFDWDDAHWRAIWAGTKEQALAIYNQYHPDSSSLTLQDVVFEPVPESDLLMVSSPVEDGPHLEQRPEELRQLHWREQGEHTCDSCGYAAMGLPEYAVCDGCYACRECGCRCGEEGRGDGSAVPARVD